MSETLERCYAAAMRILAYRFNSEAELRRKLRRKDFDDETIAATLERLRGENWLDDERFAGSLVRSRLSKRVGRLRIRRELAAAGVDDEDAARALARNLDPEAEREALVALCRKRMRILARRHGEAWLLTEEGRNKLTGYLLKQGYDAGLVHGVVRSTVREISIVHD
ncbi:MAG TPA: regulatory protein RecX [Thermoanaerobaculia bacterium]